MEALVIALMLIQFTGPTGQRIDINPMEVTSVRDPIGMPEHWVKGTHCVIVMANGKLIAVNENCGVTRSKLQGPCMLICGEARKP